MSRGDELRALAERVGGVMGWLRNWWCSQTHGGGRVTRDSMGRINWQCSECGKWATPVSHADERRAVDRALEEYRQRHALAAEADREGEG